jgi:endonuclease III
MIKKTQINTLLWLDKLEKLYPQADIELKYEKSDVWQLLVSVILSAQCTDAKVNQVTPKLFAAFPTVNDFAKAKPEDIQPLIKSLGFSTSKSQNLNKAAQMLLENYHGEVPNDRLDLQKLPGVGPKTAGVVVSNAFRIAALPVDTHVARVSFRLGLTINTNPDKIERDLQNIVPKHRWIFTHHALIWHGRRICKAIRPKCSECALENICRKKGVRVFN